MMCLLALRRRVCQNRIASISSRSAMLAKPLISWLLVITGNKAQPCLVTPEATLGWASRCLASAVTLELLLFILYRRYGSFQIVVQQEPCRCSCFRVVCGFPPWIMVTAMLLITTNFPSLPFPSPSVSARGYEKQCQGFIKLVASDSGGAVCRRTPLLYSDNYQSRVNCLK